MDFCAKAVGALLGKSPFPPWRPGAMNNGGAESLGCWRCEGLPRNAQLCPPQPPPPDPPTSFFHC